jgi:hypothetical protein
MTVEIIENLSKAQADEAAASLSARGYRVEISEQQNGLFTVRGVPQQQQQQQGGRGPENGGKPRGPFAGDDEPY